ncbi:peroxidase 44-like protein, partial [Trifolium pratense]
RLTGFGGKPDPTMDPTSATKHIKLCKSNPDGAAFLDHNTYSVVDNEYYKQLLLKRGIMEIVSGFSSDGEKFMKRFGSVMVKMRQVGVLVGKEGEIRKNCRVFRHHSTCYTRYRGLIRRIKINVPM